MQQVTESLNVKLWRAFQNLPCDPKCYAGCITKAAVQVGKGLVSTINSTEYLTYKNLSGQGKSYEDMSEVFAGFEWQIYF